MNIKKLIIEFVIVFAVALGTVALVTFLWNLIGHGESAINWETSFRFAIIFGISLTWVKLREIKEKQIFRKPGATDRWKKMKRIILFTILFTALTACTAPQTQVAPEPAATSMLQTNMPNPASVYCEQNGNKPVPAADGIQNGLCIFSDGSACDEWAYYRGECCPAPQKCPTPAMIVAAGGGGGPGGRGSTEEHVSDGYMPPDATEEIVDWWGVIKSTEPGAQYDDYFERQDLGQLIYFGVDSIDPTVKSQIEALRDSSRIVHIFGTLGVARLAQAGTSVVPMHIVALHTVSEDSLVEKRLR